MTGTLICTLEIPSPFKFDSTPYMLTLTPIKLADTARKLLAWWKMDEAGGSEAADSSGNSLTGMLVGDPQWLPSGGKFGGALKFDGVDDFIKCGPYEGLNTTGAVTIAAWIKMSKSTEDQKIAGNQDNVSGGYKLGIYSGKAELEVRDFGNALSINRFIDGGTILQPDVWYHIVGTYSQGESIKTYVNAKLDREQKTTNMLAMSSGPLKIGCEPFNDSICLFNGLMDDVRIYSYALDESEIADIYSGKMPSAAQLATVAVGEKQGGGNWVLILVIVVIAAAVVGLTIHLKKATN